MTFRKEDAVNAKNQRGRDLRSSPHLPARRSDTGAPEVNDA